MTDIILDGHEVLQITRFWITTWKTAQELLDLLEGPLKFDRRKGLETLLHKLLDSSEQIKPLIHHLESLQMKRRYDD